MSTSKLTFSSFAVAGGAGGLGSLITKELLAQGAKVIVLSRSASTVVHDGAIVRVVDYADKEGLVNALSGVEVVISALNAGGFPSQPALADAAKAAGAKLFVPSEFGNATESVTEDSLLFFKKQLHAHLRSIDLPFTLYYTGWFSDYDFIPPFGFDIAGKTITIIGRGNSKISFTTRPDVARFVAYTLTHMSEEKLRNVALRVEGDKKTLLELVPVFGQVFGGEFAVKHREVDEVEKIVKEQGAAAFFDFILLSGERGEVNLESNDNALVPGWTPLTVAEALKKHFT